MIKPFGLSQVPRKSIKNKALIAISQLKAVAEHAVDQVVRHQFAAIHELARLLAERRATHDVVTQQVAGGDLRYSIARRNQLGLRAFASPWGTEHDDRTDVADFLVHR